MTSPSEQLSSLKIAPSMHLLKLDRYSVVSRLRSIAPDPMQAVLLFLTLALLARLVLIIGVPEWGWDERRYLEDAKRFWTGARSGFWDEHQLYSFLLSPAFAFGNSYFLIIKIINLVLVCAGLIGFYLAARTITTQRSAALATALVSIIGQHSIAAHAMTEPLLFALYWWGLFALVRALRGLLPPDCEPRRALVGLSGLFCHALFLGAVIALSLASSPKFVSVWITLGAVTLALTSWLLASNAPRGLLLKRVLLVALSACLALLICFAILNEVLFRSSRGFYNAAFSMLTAQIFLGEIKQHARIVVDMIVGHIGTVLLPYCIALGAAILALIQSIRKRHHLAAVVLILGIAAVVVSAAQTFVFTVAMGHYTQITATVFARYYFFSLPIFLIGLFYLKGERTFSELVWLTGCATLILGAAWYTTYSGLSQIYPWLSIENAEQWRQYFPHWYGMVMTLWVLATAALWLLPWRVVRIIVACVFIINGGLAGTSMAIYFGAFQSNSPPACALVKRLYTQPSDRVALVGSKRVVTEAVAVSPPFNTEIIEDESLPTALVDVGDDWQPNDSLWQKLEPYDYLIVAGVPNRVFAGSAVTTIKGCALIDLRDLRRQRRNAMP